MRSSEAWGIRGDEVTWQTIHPGHLQHSNRHAWDGAKVSLDGVFYQKSVVVSEWGSTVVKTISSRWPSKTHLHRQALVSFNILVGQMIFSLCSNRKTMLATNTRKRSLPCCGTVICTWQHDSNYTFTKTECEETFLCSADWKRQREISTLPTIKLERRDITIDFVQRCNLAKACWKCCDL